MDREQLYEEILNYIEPLKCSYDEYSFKQFVVDKQGNQYRLGGEFGSGFKLHRNNYDDLLWFAQYPEDTTSKSLKWIKEHNDLLKMINEERSRVK
ncbi:hypothetical protein SAMN04487895_101577 [Paenibacillus sophorae]|uniref:Uncharacterized protein n=1 Tax=Paenibacillus sophorae TaxID=1333845 RepID=A0A1H8GP55_9BACL|nr:hypothetical protein [Paenibacillus sophorae]QWU14280.1 hypothetical protein KP014_20450 [Paenibacillus sophorae]SEN45287.1 hypothetical protein SAMN04487895_101577 [Paenibacillus sophorae]